MRVGGFQPLSLSDYPGHVSAIIFTQGCNFRCPFCHNSALLGTETTGPFDGAAAIQMLAERKRLLDGVVISGGEPTIHPDLPEFIRSIRSLGLLVKLDTNGSHPSLLKQLLKDKLLDYVAMDIKAPWAKYPMLTGGFTGIEDIQCSLNLIVQSGVASEFRTTVVPGLLTPEDVEQIRREMPVGAVHKTQDFMADYALDPALRK